MSVARRFLPDRKLAYAVLAHCRCPDCSLEAEELLPFAIEAERVHLASEQRRRYARLRRAAA